MGRKTTKADVILKEAEERIAKAAVVVDGLLEELNDAQSRLETARAILTVHQNTFAALQKSLAREPAKPSKPRAARSDKGTKRGLPTGTVSIAGPNPPPED